MALERLDRVRHAAGSLGTGAIRTSMQRTMQRHASVFRDGPMLAEGCQRIGEVAQSLGELRVGQVTHLANLHVVLLKIECHCRGNDEHARADLRACRFVNRPQSVFADRFALLCAMVEYLHRA